MIPSVPEPPAAPDGGRVTRTVALRYEDVAQDGRLTLLGLPHALGQVTWPAVLSGPEADAVRAEGVVPILVRFVLVGTDVRIPAMRPLRGEGTWHRWTAVSPDGSVDRLVLSMWVDLYGLPGTTYGGDEGREERLVGRVYGEHVLTRLFAPPGQRRVTTVLGGVPADRRVRRTFGEVATPAGEALSARPVAFGAPHTDSNQHVNSLVYPRWFEDARASDEPNGPLARWCEVAWQKPFFAGDRATLRRWRVPGGAGGAFVDAEGAERCRIAVG